MDRQVQLIPMNESHLEKTRAWLRDPMLRKQIDSLGEVADSDENRRYWLSRWKDPAQACFAILDRDDRHIGNCGLTGMDLRRRKAELWLYLESEAQGKRLGTAALHALLCHAFDERSLHRIYLRIVDGNERALNLYRKAGFRQEGRAREDTIGDPGFVDSILMGLLEREFSR